MKPYLVLISLVSAAACGAAGPAHPAEQAGAAVPVTLGTVTTEPMPRVYEAGGTVRPRTTAVLASRIVAPVIEVRVKPGDRVRRGQPLVVLDGRDLQASRARAAAGVASSAQGAAAAAAEVRSAEAALVLARASERRITALRERNSATPGEHDEAVAALRAAEARVESARARLEEARGGADTAKATEQSAAVMASYATLTAPFDGIVAERSVEPGNVAMPGVPLLIVEDGARYRLEVSVDAAWSGAVAEGNAVTVTVDGLEGPLESRVAEISRLIDPLSHAFAVKLDLPASRGLRSGMFGRAQFEGPGEPAVSVPASAIVRRGQLTFVFVEEGSVARMRVVHAGTSRASRTAVLAGVSPGERVIVNPPAGLVDGTRVLAGAAPASRRQP
jgi:RND family efflux transporter MFP subunit